MIKSCLFYSISQYIDGYKVYQGLLLSISNISYDLMTMNQSANPNIQLPQCYIIHRLLSQLYTLIGSLSKITIRYYFFTW